MVIGAVENLRFGNTQRSAFDQSTYSVESTRSQKSRSSSSFLNLGIFFNFFIFDHLLSMHLSGGDNSDFAASHSKNDV